MQISLFTMNCENNRVDKTDYLDNRFVLDGAFREDTSIIDPVFRIEKTNPALQNYNYMYIEQFNRWYFINAWNVLRTDLWEIAAHVDVLYTWREYIQYSRAIVDKTQILESANLYMDDGSFVMDSRKYNKVLNFPSGLDTTGEYVLICAGGVSS